MRRKAILVAVPVIIAMLLPALLAGCGNTKSGPHNDQEKLVDKIIRARLQGDYQPQLDAIPPDYINQIKEYMPDLSEEELQDMLITSIDSEFKSAFAYTGAELTEVFYKTVSQDAEKARVYYWGTITYLENGEAKAETVTQKDAETENLSFPLIKEGNRWYWDLEAPK